MLVLYRDARRVAAARKSLSPAIFPVVMEMLESRRLFSVSFDQGLLSVTGTNVSDVIGVRLRYERVEGHNLTMARVIVNGRAKTYGSVSALVVDGRGGNDDINVLSDALPPGWRAIDTTLLGGD